MPTVLLSTFKTQNFCCQFFFDKYILLNRIKIHCNSCVSYLTYQKGQIELVIILDEWGVSNHISHDSYSDQGIPTANNTFRWEHHAELRESWSLLNERYVS